ncbi:programmed cell death 6 protein-like protein [Strigomonas culicis]|uniref:Programmed cell death 6 protein-like protein n=1 Tax=Strigomonas culicis TaxID=28005 RepID=S9VX85_9TRYP|nr:programmed cell death 6 protein-like protein [Strigomonas culicis]EPY31606.1 programmed cell death 6 protein-like protein [Strigomonas culicis]|eukprot:EPY23681.1 programmed cell death 6 protein-like protein [Strigomonas culicis]
MFDKDGSGQITMDEFGEMHKFIQSMMTGFRQRDTSGDGRLHGNEIRVALREGGYQLSEDTFQSMMRKFDRQKRGSLGFDDYVELSIFLSKARNVFSFYDRQRVGQVTFTFDTFALGTLTVM